MRRRDHTTHDSLKLYLDEISRIPLLSYEEEVRLSKQMVSARETLKKIEERLGMPVERIVGSYRRRKEGKGELPSRLASMKEDELEGLIRKIEGAKTKLEEARKRFIEANLKLVVNIAKKYSYYRMPFLDMIDEGNLGLMKAVDRFDYRQGCRFTTYAVWWIKQALLRAMATQGRLIRIPVYLVDTLTRYMNTANRLAQELGRDPTLEEISKEMNLPLERVIWMTNIVSEPVSLELSVGEENGSELGGLLENKRGPSPQGIVFLEILHEKIKEMLSRLKPKEQMILKLRYGLDGYPPHTLEDVGSLLGITRERIRQIEAATLKKIRDLKITQELHDFLVE
jgi:RNA polymerase primary sigma factor